MSCLKPSVEMYQVEMEEQLTTAIKENHPTKEIRKLLLAKNRSNPDFYSFFGYQDDRNLVWAMLNHNADVFRLVCKLGFLSSINVKDFMGEYIIFYIIVHDQWEMFATLCEERVRFDVRTEMGWTPLMVALAFGRTKYAKEILKVYRTLKDSSIKKNLSALDVAWKIKSPLFNELLRKGNLSWWDYDEMSDRNYVSLSNIWIDHLNID